jgi:hypothetical protein
MDLLVTFVSVVDGVWRWLMGMWCSMMVLHAGGSVPTMCFSVFSYASVLESSVSFSSPVVPTMSIASPDLKSLTWLLLEAGGLYYPLRVCCLSTGVGKRGDRRLIPMEMRIGRGVQRINNTSLVCY